MSAGGGDVTSASYAKVLRTWLAETGLSREAAGKAINASAGNIQALVDGEKQLGTTRDQIKRLCAAIAGWDFDVFERLVLYGRQHGLACARYGIVIGKTLTLWYRFAGDGVTPIAPADISVMYHPDHGAGYEPPLFAQQLMAEVLRARDRTGSFFENNTVLTIFEGGSFPPRGEDERPRIDLRLGATPYALNYALRKTDAGRRKMQELMNTWTPDVQLDPLTTLALGVNVATVSADGQMLFGRRYGELGARGGQLDVGAVEGLRLDDADADGSVDVPAVMRRGVKEEFGLDYEDIQDVKVLGFGCDLQWAQWNFIGVAEADLPAAQIQARHKTNAPHGQEYKETHRVPATPADVFGFLAREQCGVWSCGLAAAYYALVNRHGVRATNEGAAGHVFTLSPLA